MKKKPFFALIFLFISISALFLISYKLENSVVGNQEILNEIDKLLLPVYNQNVTESSFLKLQKLTEGDAYASDEVSEIIVLANEKEYSHIGHSLGFLYEYVQTGKIPICPGHSLSHYYVFSKHGETDLAIGNLESAKENFGAWKSGVKKDSNYDANFNLIDSLFKRVESGNLTASDGEIDVLAELPCA